LLELSRHLGVKYDTAWLLHNKILRAMADRQKAYLLWGKIQIDDAYLGKDRPGGREGRGSENKVPTVTTFSLTQAGYPIHTRFSTVTGFSSDAIAHWAKRHHAPGSQVSLIGSPASEPWQRPTRARDHRHRRKAPQRSAAVALDQHNAQQPQD
jgi:hypothetical protein